MAASSAPCNHARPAESAKAVVLREKLEQSLPLTLTLAADLEALKKQVTLRLLERKANLPLLVEKRAALEALIASSQSPVEVERARGELRETEAAVRLVASGEELENFERDVAPLLEEYEASFPEARVLSFGAALPTDGDLCQRIILDFAAAAEKYCPLDVRCEFAAGKRVCACGRCLGDSDDFCPDCQFPVERREAAPAADRKDTDYEAKENFKHEFYRYQGLIHNQIPASLYASLDSYFAKNRIPPGALVRELFKLTEGTDGQIRKRIGKNDNGTIIRTSVSMMIDALRKTKNPGYYGDVNYICQEYWGWKLPDLSGLEEAIFRDYDAIQVEYNKLLRTADGKCEPRFSHFAKRKSNLSCRFRLYYHLRARGHACSEDDFKLVSLNNLRMEYRKLFREVFAKAGLPLPED